MPTITTTSKKQVEINKDIAVDGTIVKTITAKINTDNPQDISLNNYIVNQMLYKENRQEIRTEEGKAEDEIYEEQEKIIDEVGGAA